MYVTELLLTFSLSQNLTLNNFLDWIGLHCLSQMIHDVHITALAKGQTCNSHTA